MDYRYKQLEQELSGLSKAFTDLGARLSEAAKDAATSGVMPSEKLLEQIAASRASFESARTTVHGHATAMLVSPLPKPEDLTSIPAMASLLKAAAAAEENRLSIEGERERVLKTLARALTLAHRDNTEFKPLQECHAKVAELRNAVYNIAWPHRHPDSEALASSRHPVNALLNFVENLDTIEDEQWIALEATIAGAYGKPLFVAASRGKLEVRGEGKSEPGAKGEAKIETKPVTAPQAPPQAKAPVAPPPEAPKPVVAAEKPSEKPVAAEKASEKSTVAPAAVPLTPNAPAVAQQPITQKKIVVPAIPAAAVAVAPVLAAAAEKKEVTQEKSPAEKPAPLTVATESAPSAPGLTLVAVDKVTVDKKEADKLQPNLSPSGVPSLSPAVGSPSVANAPAATLSTPAATAAPSPVTRATPAPSATTPAVGASGQVPPPLIPSRVAPVTPVAASVAPTPIAPPVPATPVAETNSNPTPAPAAPAVATINSLSALASATEPAVEKKPATPVPADPAENHRRDPRLATPMPQAVSKSESSEANGLVAGEDQKASDGDGQRPQRWGFWRGNR